jgi:spore germination protein KC
LLRKIIKLLLCAALTLCLCGCYDANEVNDQVFPLFLGVDQGTKEELLLTIKFPTYYKQSPDTQDQVYNQGNSNVYTVEAPTILTGIEQLNTVLPRKITLSHVEFLCLGEALAKQGIANCMQPLARDSESSSTMKIMVCSGSASDYIKAHTGTMSGNYAREAAALSQDSVTAHTQYLQFGNFFNNLYSPYSDAVALMGQVVAAPKGEQSQEQQPQTQSTASNIAGPHSTQLSGLALFHGDQLVATLDEYESALLQLLQGRSPGVLSLPDPYHPGESFTLQLQADDTPKRKGGWDGSTPYVQISLVLKGSVESNQNQQPLEAKQNLEEFDRYIQTTLQQDLSSLLSSLQSYGCDPLGIGAAFMKDCPTIGQWENTQWFSLYPKVRLSVSVEYSTRRAGILYQTGEEDTMDYPGKFEKENAS